MKLTDTGLTVQDIKDKVNTYMIETYERMDFLCETARDQYMYDEKGEKYLDFYAGIAVNSAGNCNEKVVAAVIDQVQDVMHTFNYPYTIPQALLAEKVCTTIGMDKIFFQNSGTEANEAMIKMARKYGIEKYGPNKYHIVTAKNGFHGRTFGAMSATGQPGNGCQIGFGPMTYGFSYAPYNDLKAFKDACTENTIAIMIEPVQGEGGVHPATQEFMSGLREFCDENGMLLLIAALAEVNELLDRNLADNAAKMGEYFKKKLETLPHVKEVRGQGLLVGVEFDDTISAVEVKHECLHRHLLITAIGTHTIRMVPPLIIAEKDCDEAYEIIKASVVELTK